MIDTLIIGAGIAGLSLARNLSQREKNVVILEKSKGVGGRIATRRIEGLGFDHGALHFPDQEITRNLFNSLEFPINYSESGLFLSGGMNLLPKKMAEDLTILKNKKVIKLSFKNNWEIETEDGEHFQSKKVIVTAPLPQALELLEANNIHFPADLKKINYTKGLLLLGISDDVKLKDQIHQLMKMNERGLHPKGFVLRASPSFSNEHFEKKDEEIHELLLNLIELKNPTHTEIKKWRYVQPDKALTIPFMDLGQQLFMAGDSFNSPDLIGSLKSASSLFKHIYS